MSEALAAVPPRRALFFRTLARTLGLGSLGLVVGLLLAETIVRWARPQHPSWLSVYTADPVLPYALRPGARQLVDTGETRWIVLVDELGFRVRDPLTPAPGRHLLGLGDSFAFGHGVNAEDGLYEQLATRLGVPIVNAALPGFGPREYKTLLARHIDRPGLAGVVVTTYLGNDFHDSIWDKSIEIHDGGLGGRPGLQGWLQRHSHFYRLGTATAHRFELGTRFPNRSVSRELLDPENWRSGPLREASRRYATEMAEIQSLCRDHDLPLTVILIPPRHAVDDAALGVANEGAHDPSDRTLAVGKARAILEELGLFVLDTTPLLADMGAQAYYRFDGHLRPSAHEWLAESLASAWPKKADMNRPPSTDFAKARPQDPQDDR